MKKPKIFEKLSKKQAVIISAVLFALGVVCYIFSFRYNNIFGVLTLDRISGALMIAGLLMIAGAVGGSARKKAEHEDKYDSMISEMRSKIADINKETYGDEDEGKEEISIISEKLGKFIYRRKPKWYEAECEWCGVTIAVTIEVPDGDSPNEWLRNAEILFDKQRDVDRKLRLLAKNKLDAMKRENKCPDEMAETKNSVFADRIIPLSLEINSYAGFVMHYEDVIDEWTCWVDGHGTIDSGLDGVDINF